jgi:hypothetical protein
VFFPVSQYYFSRLERVFFPVSQYYFSRWERALFPVSQYYFSMWESVFPCQPVLFFYVGECFSLSASIIFLGWRVFFRQAVLFF